MEWIISNKEWLFSGAGISLILLIYGIFRWVISKSKRKNATQPEQKLKAGDNSANIQAGRDVIITNAPLGTRTEDSPSVEKELQNIAKNSEATTKNISSFSIEEAFEKIIMAPPYQRDEVARNYKGIRIECETRLHSIKKKSKNRLFLSFWLNSSTTKMVFCEVEQEEYPELRIKDENARIIIQGEIQEISTSTITLVNVNLDFPEA